MLYHYTSIDSLVQILESKTLKLNNLTACDDLEEAESMDLGKAGKYVFVSSWTDEKNESIPMWSQYSGNMSGVRIGMKEYPFKKWHYDNEGKGKPFDSFLNLDKYFNENKMVFTGDQPKLIRVEYSEDENLILPKIVKEGTKEDVERFLHGEDSKITLSFDTIGRYKRTCWKFQREFRYRVFGTPMGFNDYEHASDEKKIRLQREVIRRMFDESYKPLYQALYIELDEAAIEDMEIVFGPRMNNSEKTLLKSYLQSKGLASNCMDSSLRIR